MFNFNKMHSDVLNVFGDIATIKKSDGTTYQVSGIFDKITVSVRGDMDAVIDTDIYEFEAFTSNFMPVSYDDIVTVKGRDYIITKKIDANYGLTKLQLAEIEQDDNE